MPDPLHWTILVVTALVGSTVAGVAGFGAGVILLPVVAAVVGVRSAVPVLTVTMLLGNVARIWWSRRDIDWSVLWRFLVLAGVSSTRLSVVIGLFLLAAVPLRRLLMTRNFRVRLAHFGPLGAAIGVLSALVVTTGPVVTPFFLAYGLRRGTYIATEASCALAMHLVRGAGLAKLALLSRETIWLGLSLGATMFLGSWWGRHIVERMSEHAFLVAIEGLLIVMGLHFLLFAG
jgi:uncharacterized protein